MHGFLLFLFGLAVGAGLTWGFRGWIERKRQAAKAALLQEANKKLG